MKTIKTNVPKTSVLNIESEFKFIDAYKANFDDAADKIDIQEIAKLFFSTSPKWIDKLFNLRNRIVKFFGLKVSNALLEKELQLKNFKCEPDEQIGLFKVFYKSNNEVIIGEDDKHLDFRVSLFLEKNEQDKNQKELTITTAVKFNNWVGKVYFIPVKPFHKFIVPTMLKSIINAINNPESN